MLLIGVPLYFVVMNLIGLDTIAEELSDWFSLPPWLVDHHWAVAILLALPPALVIHVATKNRRATLAAFYDLRHIEVWGLGRKLLEGQPVKEGYFLYLRPFALDHRFTINNPYKTELGMLSSPRSLTEAPTLDLEAVIDRALVSEGNVVGIGGSDHEDSGGRITVPDTEWQKLLKSLAHQARVIFMVPAASGGCVYELRWILANELLTKTVFIMPPSAMMNSMDRDFFKKEWERALLAFRDEGLQLPQLQKTGALFCFDRDRRSSTFLRFPVPRFSFGTSPARMRRALLAFLDK